MATNAQPDAVRADVWLWSVRVYKTRSAATTACKGGHVRVNDEVAKPSTRLHVGDKVRARIQGFDRILIVRGLLKKRVGAALAAQNFEDLTPQRPRLYIPPVGRRNPGTGRPTKKERRELDRLMGRDPNKGRY
ncbi:MAG: S4 domain-containing protein [Actinomycetaceae bacterium]|nr:S4 domain-containing protein [Actinomycetaceae bacterium]